MLFPYRKSNGEKKLKYYFEIFKKYQSITLRFMIKRCWRQVETTPNSRKKTTRQSSEEKKQKGTDMNLY